MRVQAVKDKVGVLVSLSRDVVGRVTFKELADDFIKHPGMRIPCAKACFYCTHDYRLE